MSEKAIILPEITPPTFKLPDKSMFDQAFILPEISISPPTFKLPDKSMSEKAIILPEISIVP